MIGLAFASLVTWTIFIAKMIELSLIQRKLRAALGAIGDARSLAEAQFALGAKGRRAVVVAWRRRCARRGCRREFPATPASRSARHRALPRSCAPKRAAIRLGMGLLATIGATSPFVGLFGTVWGIMNSFIGISKSQTTNLAVVAPGIAEALLAHRDRSRRGDPGRHHLQSFRADDEGLSRTGQPVVGRSSAAVVARSRSHPW